MIFQEYSENFIAELLTFVAKSEPLLSVKSLGLQPDEAKKIFKELAKVLKENAGDTQEKGRYDDSSLSPRVLSLLSTLTPREEKLLFKSFHVPAR